MEEDLKGYLEWITQAGSSGTSIFAAYYRSIYSMSFLTPTSRSAQAADFHAK